MITPTSAQYQKLVGDSYVTVARRSRGDSRARWLTRASAAYTAAGRPDLAALYNARASRVRPT